VVPRVKRPYGCDAFYLFKETIMEIVYQGKPYEIEEQANGFAIAKLVDPSIKNKALGYRPDGVQPLEDNACHDAYRPRHCGANG
jgi:hypothetical protein